jgi:hypothetical protein
MYLDAQNQFSAAQAVTALGSTPSTNVIDLGVARDVGGAVTDKLMLLCQVVAAFTSGGAGTIQVQFQASNDNATWSTIVQSDVIALAALVPGYKFLQNRVPSFQSNALFRYVRLNYVVGTAVMTGGTITAAFTPDLQHAPQYPIGYLA